MTPFDDDVRDVSASAPRRRLRAVLGIIPEATNEERRLAQAFERARAIIAVHEAIARDERQARPGEAQAFPVFYRACAVADAAELTSTMTALLERAISDYESAVRRANGE